MFSLYQPLATLLRRVSQQLRGLTRHISWSNYHCLDQDAVMWESTFRTDTTRQSSTYDSQASL